MIEHIEGELEIDHNRGVIYFHCKETGCSILRLSGVHTRYPSPIPRDRGVIYDIALPLTVLDRSGEDNGSAQEWYQDLEELIPPPP